MLVGLAGAVWLMTWLLIVLALVAGVLAALRGWAQEHHRRFHHDRRGRIGR